MRTEPMNTDALYRAATLVAGRKVADIIAIVYHHIADAQEAAYTEGNVDGYNNGYDQGHEDGELSGYETGSDDGYLDGVRDARACPAGADATVAVILEDQAYDAERNAYNFMDEVESDGAIYSAVSERDAYNSLPTITPFVEFANPTEVAQAFHGERVEARQADNSMAVFADPVAVAEEAIQDALNS